MSGKPSPLQSKVATPPPTMYFQSPVKVLSMPAPVVSSMKLGTTPIVTGVAAGASVTAARNAARRIGAPLKIACIIVSRS